MSISQEAKKTSCLELFKAAYNNRYTWENSFSGYLGDCSWECGDHLIKGDFIIGPKLKPEVNNIDDVKIKKLIGEQLWEVAIHRVRRRFEDVHRENTFSLGDTNQIGKEVIVGGKNKGDKYRVKEQVVTMVYRHIHGSLIEIFTHDILDTGKGYLSQSYSSQYLDPNSLKPLKAKTHFYDDYNQLFDGGPWVLSRRSIETDSFQDQSFKKEVFTFSNLRPNSPN